MTKDRSFERVNYLTRPNKSIERKIVFENLVKLHSLMDFAKYRYVGFGSMWFGDFLFAHRLLSIDQMWSIEFEENADRANFNRPYGSIEIKPGRCGAVLGAMSGDEWKVPSVVWADYTGALTQEYVSDIRKLCVNLAPGSILLVSVNAGKRNYRVSNPERRTIPSFETVADLVGIACVTDGFRTVLDATKFPFDVSDPDFPLFLSDAMLNYIGHAIIGAGRAEGESAVEFIPMFNFSHVDGAEMVTVGGVLSRPGDAAAQVRSAVASMYKWDLTRGRPMHSRFDLIELTVKEKTALDLLLPVAGDSDFVKASRSAGVTLEEKQISKYRECYKHFPVFVESII